MKEETLQEKYYKNLNEVIGFNWRRLRQEHGLNIYELCMKTGLNLAVIGDIERGRQSRINIDICEIVAGLYQLPMEVFTQELTKGISSLSIPGKDITHANLQDVYPYNLLTVVYGQTPEPADVSLRGLDSFMNLLSEKERLVVDLRYRYGFSIERIARENNMSKERVRCLEFKVLNRLRSPGWKKMLRSYTYEDVTNAVQCERLDEKSTDDNDSDMSGFFSPIEDSDSPNIEIMGFSSRA